MTVEASPGVRMQSTTEVVLRRDQQFLFPECCVGCCAPADTARRHRAVRTGPWQAVLSCAMPGPAWWVPYCHECAQRTRRRLLLIRGVGFPVFTLVMIASVVLTTSLVGLAAAAVPIALGLTIALTCPLFMWGIAWRPPFDAMICGRELRCRFRSREYARSFEQMNDGASPERDRSQIGG